MFSMLKKMLSKLVKIITNKKVLVVLALLAVGGGAFLYFKSQKAVAVQSDVDEEEIVSNIVESNMRANISVEEETSELSQAPQGMPSVEDNLAMIE